MKKFRTDPKLIRESMRQGLGIALLLAMAGLALAGPSGVWAWGQNQRALEARRAELATLVVERDRLNNRVGLLDPRHVDRDFATELVRDRLNVASPDEKVILLR